MLGCLAWDEIARSLRLSARELQIARAVFDNLTDSAIASELRISEHTIHVHLNRLFRKLHVHTRAQLILCIVAEFMRLTLADDSPLPPVCRHHARGRCPLAPSSRG